MTSYSRYPSLFLRIAGVLLAMLLASCASTTPTTHLDEHTEHIGVKVISIVSQSDVAAAEDEHARSLIAVPLAKFEFNHQRSKTPAPNLALREALAIVDVRRELAKNLSTDLAQGAPFTITSVEPHQAPVAELDQTLRSQPEAGLLLLDTVYYFTANLRALRVETHATLYRPPPQPQNSKKRTRVKLTPHDMMYSNTLIVHDETLAAYSKKPHEYWLQDEGGRGIETLRASLREMARLIVWDINDQHQPTKKSTRSSEFSIAAYDRPGQTQISGRLMMETDTRYLVRTRDGTLYSLPNPNSSLKSTSRVN